MRSLAASIAFVLAAPSLAHAQPAADPNKQRCLDAYTAGQEAREQRRLLDARRELEICGQDLCPGPIRKDCFTWASEVEASLPSIVLGALDGTGRDVVWVNVSMDGKSIATTLDGRAIHVDPGPHSFRFESEGKKPVVLDVIVLEGQKNRLVQAKLDGGAAPPLVTSDVPKTTETGPPRASIVPPIVTGGISVVALGFFAGFGGAGASQMRDLENGCGRTQSCLQDDVDSARSKLLVGDIALLVGVVAAGATAYLLLTR